MTRTRIASIDVSEIPVGDLRVWEMTKGSLKHFPNITALGNQSKLETLRLTYNRISSVTCFPDTFKFYHLTTIDLSVNRINYICNLNFAPNITNLYLTKNPITTDLFMTSTTIPLLMLADVMMQTNKISAFSYSSLRIMDLYPRQLVPRTTRTQDNSYPGQLVPKTTRTQDNSYPRQLVPRTARTQDNSYPTVWLLQYKRR